MADVYTEKQRSYNMSKIRCSKTKPELNIKPIMKALGFAYQPKLFGRQNSADKKQMIVVFIDACF